MNIKRWCAFGLNTATIRPFIHVYPSAGNISAPYPTQIRVMIFSDGKDLKTFAIDGARLSHPDGIALGDIVESANLLAPGSYFGFTVEMFTQQARINLSSSLSMIEFLGKGVSIKFRPKAAEDQIVNGSSKSFLAIDDALSRSSLVAVNPTPQAQTPNVMVVTKSEETETSYLDLPEVGPQSCCEIPLNTPVQDWQLLEHSWGLSKVKNCYLVGGGDLYCYLIQRDVTTDRILSVVAL